MPRFTVRPLVDPTTMKALRFLAKKHEQTLAEQVAIALMSYTAPLHPDLRAGREPVFSTDQPVTKPVKRSTRGGRGRGA